jgi:hypothetical protein
MSASFTSAKLLHSSIDLTRDLHMLFLAYLSIYLCIYQSIYLSMSLEPFVWPRPLFQFLDLLHSRQDYWFGVQPAARPLPTRRTTQTQNKRTQTFMPRLGFEHTIPAFERMKTVHALDRAATVIGTVADLAILIYGYQTHVQINENVNTWLYLKSIRYIIIPKLTQLHNFNPLKSRLPTWKRTSKFGTALDSIECVSSWTVLWWFSSYWREVWCTVKQRVLRSANLY